MYLVIQNFPEEKIIFASNSQKEADHFFDLKVKHGTGWFELWEEGTDTPLQAGGEQTYSPYHSNRWDLMRAVSEMAAYEKNILPSFWR